MQRPPVRINITEHTIFGLNYRQVAWLSASAVGALFVFFSLLAGVDLVARGVIAVLLFGLGCAMAFGLIDGQLPEVWLWHCLAFARRSRYLVKGARPHAEPRAVLAAESAPIPAPAPAPLPAEAKPSTFRGWSVGAITASLLMALSLYLYTGGAMQLAAILNGI